MKTSSAERRERYKLAVLQGFAYGVLLRRFGEDDLRIISEELSQAFEQIAYGAANGTLDEAYLEELADEA